MRPGLLLLGIAIGAPAAKAQVSQTASPDESLTVVGRHPRFQPAPLPRPPDGTAPADPDAARIGQFGGAYDLAGPPLAPSRAASNGIGLQSGHRGLSATINVEAASFGAPPPAATGVGQADEQAGRADGPFEVRLYPGHDLDPAGLAVIDRAVRAAASMRPIVLVIDIGPPPHDTATRQLSLRAVGLACVRSGAAPADIVAEDGPVFPGAGASSGRRLALGISLGD